MLLEFVIGVHLVDLVSIYSVLFVPCRLEDVFFVFLLGWRVYVARKLVGIILFGAFKLCVLLSDLCGWQTVWLKSSVA